MAGLPFGLPVGGSAKQFSRRGDVQAAWAGFAWLIVIPVATFLQSPRREGQDEGSLDSVAPILADIRDADHMHVVLQSNQRGIVSHAAALTDLPLQQPTGNCLKRNPASASVEQLMTRRFGGGRSTQVVAHRQISAIRPKNICTSLRSATSQVHFRFEHRQTLKTESGIKVP